MLSYYSCKSACILLHGITIILCYVMLCCPIFWAKYWAIYKIYEQNLMIRYALCYAVLCCFMISLWKVSKILCPVMLCLWWHELKSKILWYVMLVLFVSKILCSVMNLTIYYVLFTRFLQRPARKESNWLKLQRSYSKVLNRSRAANKHRAWKIWQKE